MSRRVAILGTRYPDFDIEASVFSGLDVDIVSGPGSNPDEIVDLASEAMVVIAGSRPQFTPEVLERLTCRVIVRSGIGVDSVHLDTAARLGYTVANVPDYGTEAVAQHAFAMAMAGTRRIVEADTIVRGGGWGFDALRPMRLPSSMTAAVVGYGRIGRRVADLFKGAGFQRVVAHDVFAPPGDEDPVEAMELSELLAGSDVISLHAPGPQDGSALLGAGEIGRMKTGAVLVNTARGSLIDPDALAAGLVAGAPRVAALDVFKPEPPDLSPFQAVMDRIMFSPHTAWYTEESQAELRRKSAEQARRALSGEPLKNVIVEPDGRQP